MSFTKEFFKACIHAGDTELILYGAPHQARLLDTGERGLIVRAQDGKQEVIELIKFEDVREVTISV